MASIIDIIVWVFAGIGFILLTGIALYYIAKSIKGYTPPESPLWPSERHMEKLGAQCPTGWVYIGETEDGENICKNIYNIPVNDSNKICYDNYEEKIKNFEYIKDWDQCQDDPGNCSAFKERCDWVENCGPPSKTIDPNKCDPQGTWSSTNLGSDGSSTNLGSDGSSESSTNLGSDGSNGSSENNSNPYASWIGVADKC